MNGCTIPDELSMSSVESGPPPGPLGVSCGI